MQPEPYDQRYTAYQTDRSILRRTLRKVYLRHQAGLVRGRTIDFGCGVGELLQRLPAGSVGLEVNDATVQLCRERGLDVYPYDPLTDGYRLQELEPGRFTTLITAHVLEHLEAPIDILRHLMTSASRLGLSRVIVIVPGERGYASDATHRTLVTGDMLTSASGHGGFTLTSAQWFPLDTERLSTRFTHHEFTAVYDQP